VRRTVAFVAAVLITGTATAGCRVKQEYSCTVTLKTSGPSVTLAQDEARNWFEASPGSLFGAFETSTDRAQAQCVGIVRDRLTPALVDRYPEGVVTCACVRDADYWTD